MAEQLTILATMLALVVCSSFLASLIPGRPIPEVVFFVVAGAVMGPNCLGVIHETAGLALLSRLGMGVLFLIAGYELDLRELTGRAGRHGAVCWAVCMALATAATLALGLGLSPAGTAAFAIALTTTAYGTLVPIMRDRQLAGTAVGGVIESYGAMGELLPVVAMSVMLSPQRSMAANVGVLLGFLVLCVIVAVQGQRARAWGGRLARWVADNAETSSQATLRATLLLLVGLLALAAVLDLDAVLAAFAAGFILRHVLPDESGARLIEKVEVMGNGFLVPVFFVYSAMGINFAAVGANPALLATFVGLLLLVRALPVGVCLQLFCETRVMPVGEKVAASLYCTMALPLIVALTEAATGAGAMSDAMASVLVTAGAITVLVIPVITNVSRVAIAARPIQAAHQIAEHPETAREVLIEHRENVREAAELFHDERVALRERGVRLSAADFLAQAEHIRREHHEDLRRINAHSREELEQIRERRRDERDARRP